MRLALMRLPLHVSGKVGQASERHAWPVEGLIKPRMANDLSYSCLAKDTTMIAHMHCRGIRFAQRLRSLGPRRTIPSSYSRLHSSATLYEDASLRVGVARTLQPSDAAPTSTLFAHEFSLADRVALISGGLGGLGLEAALAFVEAGARAVYCTDLAKQPSDDWLRVRDFAAKMEDKKGEGRLEYLSADVRDQECMHKIGETIGNREGRMDVALAAAGIVGAHEDCLSTSKQNLQSAFDINVGGALFTAQAAGQQMKRFESGGSIILIASVAGYGAFAGHPITQYHSSKAAVHQMARSMACELAPLGIRVNSLSPGFMRTQFLKPYLEARPEYEEDWARMNPMGRIGEPHELRGALVWLASDASSFCTGSDIAVSGGHHAW